MNYFKYPLDSQLEAHIKEVRDFISNPPSPKNDPLEYLSASAALSNTLLQPLERALSQRDLIISPDGMLATFPFELLAGGSTPEESVDFRTLPYLIRDHNITYAFSAGLFLKDSPRNSSDRELLAFAPDFNSRRESTDQLPEEQLLALRSDTVRGGLADLQGAVREVEMLENQFPASTFLKDEATEAQFKARAGNYGILHLATHAIIDLEKPMNSYMVFSAGRIPQRMTISMPGSCTICSSMPRWRCCLHAIPAWVKSSREKA